MAIGIALFAIGVALTIAILVLRKRKVRGATSLIVFSIALSIWACAYGILLIDSQSSGRIWLALVYLSATVASTALLTFILAYTNHEEWLGKWGLFLLCLEPLLTQILFWTNCWQGYFSAGYTLTNTGIILTSSPWYWINASYSDGLLILALILFNPDFSSQVKAIHTAIHHDHHWYLYSNPHQDSKSGCICLYPSSGTAPGFFYHYGPIACL